MSELIVAMDFADPGDLLACAGELKGTVTWCKVGLEAFVLAGPELVHKLEQKGFRVFLDLKFYDIPNTVAAAVRSASRTGARLLTIHTQGGEAMCRASLAAAREAGDRRPLIFGVTVLTSFGEGQMPGIEQGPQDFAKHLASLASSWGLDGVVCSGLEAPHIKTHTNLLALCPGIRPKGASANDQARVVTPAMAVQAGADYLVVGRPITKAADPAGAARAILEEMASVPRTCPNTTC